MAIVYLYREPDENTIPDPTQLANDRVRLYTLSVTQNAEEGSIGTSSILIDDPDGDLDLVGHRILAVKEEDGGAEPFIYLGYIAERKIRRGPFRTTVGRQWEVTVVDINTILERRIMTGSDANRPAETDVQRVQWLEQTNEGHIINDTRYLFTGSPAISMDKVDYRGQSFKSVLDDCAQASGKNYYLTHFADTGTSSKYPWGVISLWYGRASRPEYVSTLALSNDPADVDMAQTFALSEDTELTRDPSRVYSGIYGMADGFAIYEQRSATALSFARRDVVSPMENVKTVTRATARATRMLDDISTEEDVITTTVHAVPASHVNLIRPGMRVPVKATHFPGYETPQVMRVLNRTVIQESETTYALRMEMSGLGEGAAVSGDVLVAIIANSGAGGVGLAPTDLSTNPWTKAFWSGDIADAGQFPGPGGPGAWGIWYRSVVPGEDKTVLTFSGINPGTNAAWIFQVAGVTVSGATDSNGNDSISGAYTSTVDSPSAGGDSVWIGGFALQKVNYGQVTLITTTAGTSLIDANALNVGGGVCNVTADTAQPRMWIGYETGTGVLTVGGTVTCTGAIPPYNLMGRGYGGVLLPLTGTFGVNQQGFNVNSVGGAVPVSLPFDP